MHKNLTICIIVIQIKASQYTKIMTINTCTLHCIVGAKHPFRDNCAACLLYNAPVKLRPNGAIQIY